MHILALVVVPDHVSLLRMADSPLQSLTANLTSSYPGQSDLILHLSSLLSLDPPPPFLYLHDQLTPNLTSRLVIDILLGLRTIQSTPFAAINAFNCFTPRLFYDSVLNQLNEWTPTWEQGCPNVGATNLSGSSWSDSVDSFLHGIKSMRHPTFSQEDENERSTPAKPNSTSKFFIFVYNAEKLGVNLPALFAPLTRLGEMVRDLILTHATSLNVKIRLVFPLASFFSPHCHGTKSSLPPELRLSHT